MKYQRKNQEIKTIDYNNVLDSPKARDIEKIYGSKDSS